MKKTSVKCELNMNSFVNRDEIFFGWAMMMFCTFF